MNVLRGVGCLLLCATHRFAGNAAYQIPSTNLVISELFEVMEEKKDEAGITDWGISQTSLEDVFLTIVRNDEGSIGFTS